MYDITALVYDDHLLFAEAFSVLIGQLNIYKKIKVFNDETTLNGFLMRNQELCIHLYMDYYVGSGTSLMEISYVKRIITDVKFIYVSSITNALDIKSVLKHKVDGFISKSSDAGVLLKCIDALKKNRTYICPITRQILKTIPDYTDIVFTTRELDMLQYFFNGLSISETAAKTNLSKHTIIAHRRNMMEKTNTNSISQLLAYARKHKIL